MLVCGLRIWLKESAVCSLELAGLPDPFLLLVGCTSTYKTHNVRMVVWLYIRMVVPQPTPSYLQDLQHTNDCGCTYKWLYLNPPTRPTYQPSCVVVPQPTLLPTYNIQMVVCLYLLDWLSISLVQICIVQHFLRFFKQVLSIDLIEKSLRFSMRKVN